MSPAVRRSRPLAAALARVGETGAGDQQPQTFPCKVNVATLQKAAVDHWSEPGAYRRQLIIHDRAVDRTLSEYQHCETPDLSIAASRLNVAVCWTPSAKPTAMQPGSAVQSASSSASFVLGVTRSSSAS
jgi:hypothetical protein